MQTPQEERLAAVEEKLDRISGQLQTLLDAQRPFAELAAEMGPIASEVMSTSVDQLAHLEERGYFAFAREIKYLLERIVEDYHPGDLHELADNAANILDTVKAATQPSVMAALRDAVEAFEDPRRLKPLGVFGAYRKIRKDKNVQRGLAFALDLLGRVGRATARAPRMSRNGTALPSATSRPRLSPPARSSSKNGAPAKSSPPVVASSNGAPATPDLHTFVPDDEWSRELAVSRAEMLGIVELSEEHWKLVECVRLEYTKAGSTPNIRKITHISGLTTREVYTLFPKAPGLTVACIACVPKPVGCL